MSYEEVIQKIDEVISNINLRIQQINKKIEIYSRQIKQRKKEENKKKYQYELERDNYSILKCNNEIKKSELFKKRCSYYKEYLFYIKNNDLINIKKSEYNFIKTLQEETILFFDSREEELKQRAILERICDKNTISIYKLTSLEKLRDEKYEMFLKDDFYLEENRLYTLNYLNYDINEVTSLIYEHDIKRKVS